MTGIPAPHRHPGTLAICDGHDCVGYVIESDNSSFLSFDRDEVLLGEFPTRRQAVRAIPADAGISTAEPPKHKSSSKK